MTARHRLLGTALLVATVGLFAHDAPAQSAKTTAESLFQAAKTLMGESKFAEACPKFAESQRLDPSPGTLLNLGKCYEGLGKPASAWAEYKSAAVLAHQLGQKEREDGARELATALEPKLSRLTLQAAATPGLVVKSDGVEIGAASFGTALFVDPGEHVIEASAPGYATWTGKVTVGPNGDSKTASVPALIKKPEVAVEPSASAAASGSGSAPPLAYRAPTDNPEGTSTMRVASFVLMGVGVVGIGVGGVMGGLAASEVGDARNDPTLCPDNQCTPAGRAAVNEASTKALVSTIALPVGIAAAGAGVVLLLLSPPPSASKPAGTGPRNVRQAQPRPRVGVAVAPVIGPDGAAVSIRGSF